MLAVQAAACGLMGYGIGTGAACAIGAFGGPAGIPFVLGWPIPVATAAGVACVCAAAVAVSARPLVRLEPAEVFRA
ncbi:MAG TPA: hypothetical protein VF796_23645, partial [Humisphaera sp.]